MKDKWNKLKKGLTEIKETASKLSQEAIKNTELVKGAVKTGVDTSKEVLKKAQDTLHRDNLNKGIEVASKGADLAARGARIASKGYETAANTLEKAAETLKSTSEKLKKKD